MNRSASPILLLIILIFSCTSHELDGLDSVLWKEDKGGCNGYRSSVLVILQEQQDVLQKMDVKELRSLLGNPDKHELEERNRRRFTYLAESGPHCNGNEPLPDTKNLTVRIGPLGEVLEITFY